MSKADWQTRGFRALPSSSADTPMSMGMELSTKPAEWLICFPCCFVKTKHNITAQGCCFQDKHQELARLGGMKAPLSCPPHKYGSAQPFAEDYFPGKDFFALDVCWWEVAKVYHACKQLPTNLQTRLGQKKWPRTLLIWRCNSQSPAYVQQQRPKDLPRPKCPQTSNRNWFASASQLHHRCECQIT